MAEQSVMKYEDSDSVLAAQTQDVLYPTITLKKQQQPSQLQYYKYMQPDTNVKNMKLLTSVCRCSVQWLSTLPAQGFYGVEESCLKGPSYGALLQGRRRNCMR